ncbi:Dihydrodipicolinate synthase/N-acetylneuraminate lyase [Cyclobacterium lianum]|uniref:Dihydrodipicolinate synthase/N-acetylneuraminate lyase n=1 Tax=Cyclobacterium lianum TaxID=388280 RepID=A0A1M7P863_9BACT|nr:dihydrodipicolinate synthase family protein [Cyclobacterium lianum]SHN12885.1 Dihydrodipicolinate synthase/N-acetylneuraminate lyase [Cyclobacterium lianum]
MNQIDPIKKNHLQEGLVIPAHPLALDAQRKLDETHQRALSRYYLASGAGGMAVGVHSTQFEIRDQKHGLLEPVLKMAMEEVKAANLEKPFLMVAGIVGGTDQALREAEVAKGMGYDLGLLSAGGLGEWTERQLIKRAEQVAEVIPLFGFYLQPSAGGRLLSHEFWKDFADIPNVHAIKMAPFNRYQTLDVVRAVCASPRRDEIALYTGNDDNIVADLLSSFSFVVNGQFVHKKIVGGLLGHWAVWTRRAVELLQRVKESQGRGATEISDLLTLGAQITDTNAAIFDPAHQFRGCIPGIHEILRRQGLLQGRWCLNPEEELSPGQMEEIDRVYRDYPELNDDSFVSRHLPAFLKPRQSAR